MIKSELVERISVQSRFPAECRKLSMRKEIRAGSTVRLKSGGPHMNVEVIFLHRDGGRVRCIWTDGTKTISQMFDLDAVEQANVEA